MNTTRPSRSQFANTPARTAKRSGVTNPSPCLRLAGVVLTSALAAITVPAHADENLFGYVYGAETLPKGAGEIYTWITRRHDKGVGAYRALDAQIELEYGITDRLQGSLYLTGNKHTIRGVSQPDENGDADIPDLKRNFAFNGVKASAKYMFKSPYKDGYGLSMYVEPTFTRYQKVRGTEARQYSVEFRGIFQKNFLDDQLVFAANLWLEPEWRKFKSTGEKESEVEAELDLGLSYRFMPKWYAGLEYRYHSEYPNSGTYTLQLSKREHSAHFLGPTLHYGDKNWWFTATWLPQLGGRPLDRSVSNRLHLDEHERAEYRLKVGYNF